MSEAQLPVDEASAIIEQLKPETLNFLAWSALWSSLTEDELREAAWQALELPGTLAEVNAAYWSLFHAGIPQPPIPALVHAMLNLDGAGVREDWMRAATYLDLTWSHARLPPDQLGTACEIFAMACEREEPVIIDTLVERYLLPWLDQAQKLLNANEQPALATMLARFRTHIDEARALSARVARALRTAHDSGVKPH